MNETVRKGKDINKERKEEAAMNEPTAKRHKKGKAEEDILLGYNMVYLTT